MSQHTCPRCGETKDESEFPPEGERRLYLCLACRAREQAAIRAGIRKDKCATCGTAIEGRGVCEPCMAAMKVLGGTPEALRKAGLALKWIQGQ